MSVLRGGTMNRSEENVQPQTPHSFVSASLASASESVISASQERRHQSMLGTVRLPRANSDENLADLDSRSSNSGSDVPSQTTSDDDGSSDSDSDEVRTKVHLGHHSFSAYLYAMLMLIVRIIASFL